MKRRVGPPTFIFIMICGLCGGSIFPLIKLGRPYEIPKINYLFYEALIVVAFIALSSAIRPLRLRYSSSHLIYFLFCAFTNIIIPQCIFMAIAPHLQANVIALIVVLTPLFVYLTTPLVFGGRYSLTSLGGVVLGLLGTATLLTPFIQKSHNLLSLQWMLCTLALPLVFCINRLFATKLKPHDLGPRELTLGLFTMVAIITGIATLSLNQLPSVIPLFHFGHQLLAIHSIVMLIYYCAFFTLAQEGSLKNSLSFFIAPLVLMSWGVILFGENLTSRFFISALLTFLGLHFVLQSYKISPTSRAGYLAKHN